MNKTFKKILLGTGFSALSLVALNTASWSMNHGGMMGRDPARMLAHMTERLDLTPEQHEEVAGLLTSAQEATGADRERLTQLRRELREQLADFDEARARELADEVGQITATMVFEATSTQARVQAVLRPEQREEMRRMMDKRMERRGKWHGAGDAGGH